MSSKNIPKETTELVKKIAVDFPKRTDLACKAIAKHMRENYRYGANENILQETWSRYPHQVKKLMNCNDWGIFTFLLADAAGLDSVLVRFENYEGIEQPHLATLVRGSTNDYIITNGVANTISLERHKAEIGKEKISFDKMVLIDKTRLVEYTEDINSGGIRTFLGEGQLLKRYLGMNLEDKIPMIFETDTFLKIQDDVLEVRRSYGLPAFFIDATFLPGEYSIDVSSGHNNSKLLNSTELVHVSHTADKVTVRRIGAEKREKLSKATYRYMFNISALKAAMENKPAVIGSLTKHSKNIFESEIDEFLFFAAAISHTKRGKKDFEKFYSEKKKKHITNLYKQYWTLFDFCNATRKSSPENQYFLDTFDKVISICDREGIKHYSFKK